MDTGLGELAFQADAGDPDAQYRMGVLFLLGESVEQDLRAAYLWAARAAAGQHQGAQALIENLALCRDIPAGKAKGRLAVMITDRAVLFSAAALRVATTISIAISRTVAAFGERRLRGLVAKVRFNTGTRIADFTPRRTEAFDFPEVS